LVSAGLFFSGSSAFADNNIKSKHIAEADGYSGQNTNRGKGIKTDHIQNGAVTDAKIRDLSMGKVTGLVDALENIELTPGPEGPMGPVGPVGPAGADGSDGEIGPQGSQGIAGIDGADGEVGPQGPEGPAALYGNMTIVATVGGEYMSPVDAMNDIASWCGTPSVSNPCLVKVMPGVYDLSTESITMVSNVSFEGSGAAVTKITTSAQGTIIAGAAPYSNVSLSALTLESTADNASVLQVGGSSSISISDSALIAAGGNSATAVSFGKHGSLNMNDSTISASGDTNVSGLYSTDHDTIRLSDVLVDVSSLSTTNYHIARAIYTYSYWYGFDNLIELNNVTANATSTYARNYGVQLTGYKEIRGVAKLTNVKANATGGYTNQAVAIQGPYNVSMNGVVAVGADGTYNYGVASTSYGYGPHTVEIMNSSLSGSTASVSNGSGGEEVMRIANTKLDGAVLNDTSAILKCNGSYDGNFDDVICP
ncbi:MAG: collagen-like protein, partial [Gammaproteobacteria bacterium]|nr:collagen-like protein [Gammaproteobacteria bacterium]